MFEENGFLPVGLKKTHRGLEVSRYISRYVSVDISFDTFHEESIEGQVMIIPQTYRDLHLLCNPSI